MPFAPGFLLSRERRLNATALQLARLGPMFQRRFFSGGGKVPGGVIASATPGTARRVRAIPGIAVAAALWLAPAATLAGEAVSPAGKSDTAVVFGLTATELAVAGAIGVGAGAAAAFASGNAL